MDWYCAHLDVHAILVCHGEERAECESGAADLRSCLHLWERALGGDGTNETVNRSAGNGPPP